MLDILERMGSWYDDKKLTVVRKTALHSLSKRLARNIELAKKHKAAGLKQGDVIFQRLWLDCESAICEFCATYECEQDKVYMQVPCLQGLLKLSKEPEPEAKKIERYTENTKHVAFVVVPAFFVITIFWSMYSGLLVRLNHLIVSGHWGW